MAGLSAKIGLPSRDRVQADFSLTTVNIVLLLIFFFLITGTLVQTDEMAVDLAETQDLPLDRLPRPLLLMLPGENWSLDGEAVTAATLAPALEALLADNGATPQVLHLLPDRHLPAAELISVLRHPDLAQVQIKLVTLRLPSGAQ